jgi:membrane protein YqaA with SNARE-associated domain
VLDEERCKEQEERAKPPSALEKRFEQMMCSKHALWGVFLASLAETTVVPIPIETVLIPVMVTNRRRAWLVASITLLGCLVGATIGYLIGAFAFETVGEWVLETAGWTEQFEEQRQQLAEGGFWHVLAIAVTPVPYQLAYLGAGAVGISYPVFLAASAVGRGVRYFGLALLVTLVGKAANQWLERYAARIAIGVTLLFILGYVLFTVIF